MSEVIEKARGLKSPLGYSLIAVASKRDADKAKKVLNAKGYKYKVKRFKHEGKEYYAIFVPAKIREGVAELLTVVKKNGVDAALAIIAGLAGGAASGIASAMVKEKMKRKSKRNVPTWARGKYARRKIETKIFKSKKEAKKYEAEMEKKGYFAITRHRYREGTWAVHVYERGAKEKEAEKLIKEGIPVTPETLKNRSALLAAYRKFMKEKLHRLIKKGYSPQKAMEIAAKEWKRAIGIRRYSPMFTAENRRILREEGYVCVPPTTYKRDGKIIHRRGYCRKLPKHVKSGGERIPPAGVVPKKYQKIIEEEAREELIHSAKNIGKYWRMQVLPPEEFEKGSFRTHDIGRPEGHKRIAGILKKTGKWATQSFLLPINWYEREGDTLMPLTERAKRFWSEFSRKYMTKWVGGARFVAVPKTVKYYAKNPKDVDAVEKAVVEGVPESAKPTPAMRKAHELAARALKIAAKYVREGMRRSKALKKAWQEVLGKVRENPKDYETILYMISNMVENAYTTGILEEKSEILCNLRGLAQALTSQELNTIEEQYPFIYLLMTDESVTDDILTKAYREAMDLRGLVIKKNPEWKTLILTDTEEAASDIKNILNKSGIDADMEKKAGYFVVKVPEDSYQLAVDIRDSYLSNQIPRVAANPKNFKVEVPTCPYDGAVLEFVELGTKPDGNVAPMFRCPRCGKEYFL